MTITCPRLLMSFSVTGGVGLVALKDDHHLSSAVDVSVAGGVGLAVLKNDHYMSSAVDVSPSGRWCGAGCPQG